MRLFHSVYLVRAAALAGCFACGLMAADWISIQPGASIDGWVRVPMKPSETLVSPNQWHVEPDGYLLCDGSHDASHEFLRYDRELRNFALHVEWRFVKVPGETKYNSGVYVRNTADGGVWYQAQVGPPSNGGYFFYDEIGTDGSKKRVNLKSEMPSNPLNEPGEWNTYDIRAQGPRITLVVNDVETSHFDCDRQSGYIGLEAEYYKIEFRNIKLKELP